VTLDLFVQGLEYLLAKVRRVRIAHGQIGVIGVDGNSQGQAVAFYLYLFNKMPVLAASVR
jgi:hypothetical protein